MALLKGHATSEGTRRFAQRVIAASKGAIRQDFYREIEGLTLSTLGLGTYLGEANSRDDQALEKALVTAIHGGINVLDTASCYRHQRSERVIGQVLARLIQDKVIARDEIFISTKGGFIAFDGEDPQDPEKYFDDTFIKTEILKPSDVAAGCHSLSERFIENQFEQSRRNLGLETLELYYLHNPEMQLDDFPRTEVGVRIQRAFHFLETRVTEGHLLFYGTATWNAYRVEASAKDSLNLKTISQAAAKDGAAHFKFIQLPLNLAMPEALSTAGQDGSPILEVTQELGIHVMTSASIMQGQIIGKLGPDLNFLAPGAPDAVKALNYARSAPGVDVALCGMKQVSHVSENLKLASQAPVSAADLEGRRA